MRLTMVGRLDACLLLSLRSPCEALQPLVPRGLTLVTHGQWGFWNIVISRITAMRPAGLPKWLGMNYHHAAYRLYVKAHSADGAEVQGLQFLRSDADKGTLCTVGNWLTDFRFHSARIEVPEGNHFGTYRIRTEDHAADLQLIVRAGTAKEPPFDTCFASLKEQESFLKYRPFGLCPDRKGEGLRIARVGRDESLWRETPVAIEGFQCSFFAGLALPPPILERATLVDPLEYRWELGEKVGLE